MAALLKWSTTATRYPNQDCMNQGLIHWHLSAASPDLETPGQDWFSLLSQVINAPPSQFRAGIKNHLQMSLCDLKMAGSYTIAHKMHEIPTIKAWIAETLYMLF